MKNKYINVLMGIGIILIAITGCTKTEVVYEGSRPTIVSLPQSVVPITVIARDITPAIEEFDLLIVGRNATRPEDLKASLTAKVAKSAQLVTNYNTANGTSFIELPSAAYTLSDDLNNIVFASGEFVKTIKMKLDKSQLDLSKLYAIGFTLTETGTGAKVGVQKTALFSIGVKNQYDGKYQLKGAFYHPASSPGYSTYTVNVEMHTTGPNSVKIFWNGGYFHPKYNLGNIDAFALQEPNYTIDPTTKKVTVQNSAVGAVTFYTTPTSYDSRYVSASKTIFARFGYNYAAGGVFDPAANREWTDELIYVGPR